MSDIKAFIDALQRKKAERYKALGILPGEGGRFAPNMQGYEEAVADAISLLPLLRNQPDPLHRNNTLRG